MIEVAEILQWVERFDPPADERASRSKEETLDLLAREERPLARSRFQPGHITASALVWSPDGAEVLLVFHPRLRRWLQPGGHLEDTDTVIAEAARREVVEETGVLVDDTIPPTLVSLDVHDIPANDREPAHRHHDLMFRFVAAGRGPEPISGALRAAWCAPHRLAEFGADAPLLLAVRRTMTAIRPDLTP